MPRCSDEIGGDDMAFSGSSYFFGIGTAFAAIAVGFAGGAMVTTSAVQPPNRLERVSSNAPAPSNPAATPPSVVAPSNPENTSAAEPAPQEAPLPPVATTASSASSADPQPQPAASVTDK